MTPPTTKRASRPRALSPSRAKDFEQCPLMFRLRTVDKIPEPPAPAAIRGTLIHAVLENLYDLDAADRTEASAMEMLEPQWERMKQRDPWVTGIFDSGEIAQESWLAEARLLLAAYFQMENPQRLEPSGREEFVEARTPSGILLRGIIDRIDTAPGSGALRVVDYKSGKSPHPRFMEGALFQMRFYAYLLYLARGLTPARLQLIYLRDARILTLDPGPADLRGIEGHIERLWGEIETAAHSNDFPPRQTKLCGWCSFQAHCPLYGGQTPPVNTEELAALLTVRQAPGA